MYGIIPLVYMYMYTRGIIPYVLSIQNYMYALQQISIVPLMYTYMYM